VPAEYQNGRFSPGAVTLNNKKKRSAATAQAISARTIVCTDKDDLDFADLSKEMPTEIQEEDAKAKAVIDLTVLKRTETL
jgi:hypothetical protein